MAGLKIELPKGWGSLTNPQLVYVCRMMLTPKMSKNDFLVQVFFKFAGIRVLEGCIGQGANRKYYLYHKDVGNFSLYSYQIMQYARTLDFLITRIDMFNPIQSLCGEKARNNHLNDINFESYLFLIAYYKFFQDTKDSIWLDKMIAVMYSPEGTIVNSDYIKENHPKFKRLHIHVKYSVFLWFGAFQNYLSKVCPNMFDGGSGGNSSLRDTVLGMLNMLNKDDVTKNPEIKASDLYEAMDTLDKICKKINQQIEANENN